MEEHDQISCVFKDTLETCNTLKRFDSKTSSTKQKSTMFRCSQEREITTFLQVSQKVLSRAITRIVMLNTHQIKRSIAI